MKRYVLIVFLVFIAITPVQAEQPKFQATTANIVGWNLAGFNAIATEKATLFAEAITYMDLEIIALVR